MFGNNIFYYQTIKNKNKIHKKKNYFFKNILLKNDEK